MKKEYLFPLVISLLLAFIPLLWLKPGWMDLGGDSSRLYFYDPISYLKSAPLYGLAPDGFASENISFYLIPFVSLLIILKEILRSSYLVILIFNSFQLVISFLSIYGITREFLKEREKNSKHIENSIFAGCIAGLFYTLSPFLSPNGWDKAMFIHNQFFLNPLIFFLLLKYVYTKKMQYILLCVLVTFIFAANFSPSPAFFAFYPLAILYLLFYTFLIKKTTLGIKNIAFIFLLFFVVHIFHLIPIFINLFFSSGNVFYQAAFSQEGKFVRGLGYFSAVAETTKLTNNILSLPQGESSVATYLEFLWFTFPVLLILGLLVQKKLKHILSEINYNFLLLFSFFLLTLFLSSAVITHTGLAIYKLLFNIPGFSMFRNYVGQFSFVFIFFYTLTLSYALFYIFSYLDKQKRVILFVVLLVIISISSWSFIRGDMINLVINKGAATEITVPIKMDPVYEEVLDYIRKDPIDARYLTLPFTEAGLQMLAGVEGGAYQGPSTIAYLTGKKDFSGYLTMLPFSEQFLQYSKEKDYRKIQYLLTLFGVKYIFHNSDKYIYKDNFPAVPYNNVSSFLPATQGLYESFINNLNIQKKKDYSSKYHLYEISDSVYLPHLYIANKNILLHNQNADVTLPFFFENEQIRPAIVESEVQKKSSLQIDVSYKLVSPENKFIQEMQNYYLPKITTSVTQEQYVFIQPLFALQEVINKSTSRNIQKTLSEQIDKLEENKKMLSSIMHGFKNIQQIESGILLYENDVARIRTLISSEEIFADDFLYQKLSRLIIKHQNELLSDLQYVSQQQKSSVGKIIYDRFNLFYKTLPLQENRITSKYDIKDIIPSYQAEIFFDKKLFVPDSVFQIKINNQLHEANNTDKEWLSLGSYRFDSSKMIEIDTVLFDNSKKSDDTFFSINTPFSVRLKGSDNFFGIITTLVKSLETWQFNTTYILSFDYIARDETNTQWWNTYVARFSGDEKSNDIYFEARIVPKVKQVAASYNGENITAINIASLPKVPIVFRDEINNRKISPIISFQKINPTAYRVEIENITEPYTLVFLDAYSSKWKLYQASESLSGIETVKEYFNGAIKEKRQEEHLFYKELLQKNSSPVAMDRHFKVNGYANGWYIKPDDGPARNKHIFLLEMSGQPVFYKAFFISTIGIGGCTAWLFVLLLKKRNT